MIVEKPFMLSGNTVLPPSILNNRRFRTSGAIRPAPIRHGVTDESCAAPSRSSLCSEGGTFSYNLTRRKNMSDYQAVFDAVRSRISDCNVGAVLVDAARQAFDTSVVMQLAHEAIGRISYEMTRPSAVYRPVLTQDGDAWLALYGENLQVAVVGCGETPEAAMCDFDKAWNAAAITANDRPVTPPTEQQAVLKAAANGTVARAEAHFDHIDLVAEQSPDVREVTDADVDAAVAANGEPGDPGHPLKCVVAFLERIRKTYLSRGSRDFRDGQRALSICRAVVLLDTTDPAGRRPDVDKLLAHNVAVASDKIEKALTPQKARRP